ncbi:unnamed protein product [Rotaria socialis]
MTSTRILNRCMKNGYAKQEYPLQQFIVGAQLFRHTNPNENQYLYLSTEVNVPPYIYHGINTPYIIKPPIRATIVHVLPSFFFKCEIPAIKKSNAAKRPITPETILKVGIIWFAGHSLLYKLPTISWDKDIVILLSMTLNMKICKMIAPSFLTASNHNMYKVTSVKRTKKKSKATTITL